MRSLIFHTSVKNNNVHNPLEASGQWQWARTVNGNSVVVKRKRARVTGCYVERLLTVDRMLISTRPPARDGTSPAAGP